MAHNDLRKDKYICMINVGGERTLAVFHLQARTALLLASYYLHLHLLPVRVLGEGEESRQWCGHM